MSSQVRPRLRSLLVRSLPLVEQRRDLLVDAMERHLAAIATEEEAFGQPEITAMLLVDLLLREVRALVETAEFSGLAGTAAEHRALEINGRHYSRFGDALVPVLRDLLGPVTPRAVASAWCDAFWAIVRTAQAAERVPA
jgi:hemoglobin-like flavoprotein